MHLPCTGQGLCCVMHNSGKKQSPPLWTPLPIAKEHAILVIFYPQVNTCCITLLNVILKKRGCCKGKWHGMSWTQGGGEGFSDKGCWRKGRSYPGQWQVGIPQRERSVGKYLRDGPHIVLGETVERLVWRGHSVKAWCGTSRLETPEDCLLFPLLSQTHLP